MTGGASSEAADDPGSGIIGEPQVLTLEEGESVLSVSPSGDHLVTVVESTSAEGDGAEGEDSAARVCVRSGPDYQTADCSGADGLAGSARGAAWSADESLLAFVHPSSPLGDVVCILDLATGEVRSVTDPDGQAAAPVVLTWLADGRVAFTWARQGGTEIRAVDPTESGAQAQTLQTIPDATIDELFATGPGVLAAGEIGQEKAVFDLGDGTGSPALFAPTPPSSAVVAVDSVGEQITLQRWDTHTALPLVVVRTSTGQEVVLGETDPVRMAVAADFSPDDSHLLTLSYVGVSGELAIRDRDLETVVALELDRPREASEYGGLDWTERGIVLISSTGGHPQRVSVYPVERPGS